MQLAHPKVAAGVDEHSDFRTHPIRRLRRTIRMTMAIVFGDRDTALAAARGVNQAHAKVQGDGYRALDPDLLLWVYATLADTALVTYEVFVRRLLPSEREEFHQEFKLLGELLGIPHDRFPDTVRDFDDYMERMVASGPVVVDERARDLAQQVMKPRVWLLPGPAMIPLNVVTSGLLSPALREQYGLAWGPRQQRAYQLAVAVVPRLIALTPSLLRVWPRPGRSIVFTAGGRATTTS
jgi:uncharacterized protein (DUF2236 family)